MKQVFTIIIVTILFSQCTSPLPKQEEAGKPLGGEHAISRFQKGKSQPGNIPVSEISKDKGSSSAFVFKKKKKRHHARFSPDLQTGFIQRDSLRISKIEALRKIQAVIDLNEPANREFLLSSVTNRPFTSMITLSKETLLKISFDNDILDYTDRFYTNGIRFDLINPLFRLSPISKLMVPYWRSGTNYYGITLVQNMYTPSTTKVDGILFGDRPYAAYLYFGTFKITNDSKNLFRMKSELDIGVIGSYSFGEYIQKSFHNEVPTNSTPLGWEYQIKNDLILNYQLSCEKGILNKDYIDIIATGTGSLGSLYTNISGGFHFRTGMMNPYFVNLGQAKRKFNKENHLRNTQVIFFITSIGKFIGYDATLEGGLFDKSSVYTIGSGNISRFVLQSSAGLTLVYGGVRFDVEQYILSPEFHNGWWHKWVHVAFTFSL